MSLDEEITIYQFGQGISTDKELLSHFMNLDEEQQKVQFYELYHLVRDMNVLESDIEQALAESPLTPDYTPCIQPKVYRLVWAMTRLNQERDYTFLLYLFRTVYRRQDMLKEKESSSWHNQDLSDPAIVQNILITHQNLKEAIYTAPSYRSEFLSLAKLWHEQTNFPNRDDQKPNPESTNRFQFMKYDDLVTASINTFSIKNMRAITTLRYSLEKALTLSYRLNPKQTRRLVLEILDRHLQEKYNTPLY